MLRLLALAPAVGSAPATSPATAPAAKSPAEAVSIRLRMSYDLARVPMSALGANAPWMVARVEQERCGWIEHPDWEMGENGEPVDRRRPAAPAVPGAPAPPEESRAVGVQRLEVLESFGKLPDGSAYLVAVIPGGLRAGRDVNRGMAEELYDVFAASGDVVLCRVNEGYPGRHRYSPVILIKPEWQKLVQPAMREYWNNRRVFDEPERAREMAAELRKVMAGENPFLASAACRTLASDPGVLDVAALGDTILAAEPIRQGAFTIAILTKGPPGDRPARLEALGKIVDRAEGFGPVRGIMAGVLCALYNPPPQANPRHWREGLPLAEKLAEKASAAKDLTDVDRQLVETFRRQLGRTRRMIELEERQSK